MASLVVRLALVFSLSYAAQPQSLGTKLRTVELMQRNVRPALGNRISRPGALSREEAFPDQASFITNFGLQVGTKPRTNDVVADDLTKYDFTPDAPSFHQIDEAEAFALFYVSQNPDLDVQNPIRLEKPLVYAEKEGVRPQIVGWRTGLHEVPKNNEGEELLPVTIKFFCDTPGTHTVVTRLRVFGIEDGKPTRREASFLMQKVCSEEGEGQETESDVIPGFMVGQTAESADVIDEGNPRPGYAVTVGGDGNDLVYKTHMEQSWKLYIRGETNTVLEEPIVLVENPLVVVVELAGPVLQGDTSLDPEKATMMRLDFHCRRAGQTVVTLIFAFVGLEEAKSTFSFTKKCEEKHTETMKVVAEGLRIGLSMGANDIANDGYVKRQFRLPTLEEDHVQRYNIDETVSSLDIYVTTTESSSMQLAAPVCAAFHSDRTQTQIVRAEATSKQDVAHTLTKSAPLMFTLEFTCLGSGTNAVVVRLPTQEGVIDWILQKTCSTGSGSAAGVVRDGIHGFLIRKKGRSTTFLNKTVLEHGIAQGDFSWTDKWDDLYQIKDFNLYVTLLLQQLVDDEADLIFGHPQFLFSLDIMTPVITGDGADGGVVSADDPGRISITFHCHEVGLAQVAVVIPVFGDEDGTDLEAPLVFNFRKHCTDSPDHVSTGMGGVGISGFNIGTAQHGSDVVLNGFPQPSYYGQRREDKPNWEHVMVPADVDSLTLFVNFNLVYGASVAGNKVRHQTPQVISQMPSILSDVRLAGAAAAAGEIEVGQSKQLEIHFNCRQAGLSPVTVIFPLVPHGHITFTVPKTCGGTVLEDDVPALAGLSVIMMSGKTPRSVMDNGVVDKSFDVTTRASRNRISVKEASSEFILFYDPPTNNDDALSLSAIEPHVFAEKPTFNPIVKHDLHVASEKADKDLNMLGIAIPVRQRVSMVVEYNCAWEGSSLMTIVIPLLPTGRIAFRWNVEAMPSCSPTDDMSAWVNSEWIKDDWSDATLVAPAPPPPRDNVDNEFDDDDYLFEDSSWSDWSDPTEGWSDFNDGEWELDNDMDTWDEWRADPDLSVIDAAHPSFAEQTGFIDVGTEADAYDIIHRRFTAERELKNGVAVIDRQTNKTSFYLSVPFMSQKFNPPKLLVSPSGVTENTLTGEAASGGVIDTTSSQRLTVNFKCLRPGRVVVLVTIPFDPPSLGTESFRLTKLCGGYMKKKQWYWTASRIIMLAGVMVAVVLGLGVVAFLRLRKRKNYMALPTSLTQQQRPKNVVPEVQLDMIDDDDSD